MQPHKWMLGLMAFSFVLLVIIGMWQSQITDYDLDINTSDEWSGVYNLTTEMYDFSEDVKDNSIDADTEGGDESWESLIKGGYSGVRLIGGSFAMIEAIIQASAKKLGVPSFFVYFAMTAIIISVCFMAIYMVFRFQPK